MTIKILIVGETYNQDEWGAKPREPLSIASGRGRVFHFFRRKAAIHSSDFIIEYVFPALPGNNTSCYSFTGSKEQGIPGSTAIFKQRYVLKEYQKWLTQLDQKVKALQPNLVLLLGRAPLWWATGSTDLDKQRGYPFWLDRLGVKAIATYAVDDILKRWNLNPVFLSDLDKARAESETPVLTRPNHEIWIRPTLKDLIRFENLHIFPNKGKHPLSVDIETQGGLITCIGFSPLQEIGLVVPFVDWDKPNKAYWETAEDEFTAWKWVGRILKTHPNVLGQNFSYDFKYLRLYGINTTGYNEDTILLAHSLQPELKKSLAFLASLHTREASWKFMRTTEKMLKQDD